MSRDAEQWLTEASLEALQCRELRHAWPRGQTQRTRKLKDAANVRWRREPGAIIREMECVGGCGVVRIETFTVAANGSLRREGRPRYRYPDGYLRSRAKDEAPLEPIEPDTLRGIVVRRLFPNLNW
jgi:hypothetical protein